MAARSSRPSIHIRPGRLEDLPAITAIYNQAVANTTATFDTVPQTVAQQEEWFVGHGQQYPVLVATHDDEVAGWAALSPWSERCAYETTCEVSIYISESYRGLGIGGQLLDALLQAGREAGLHLVLARITEGNPASERLHAQAGFQPIGIMHEAGYKFGHYLDVLIMELLLGGSRK